MELTPEQVVLVGLVASCLSVIIKLLASWFGLKLSKFWMTVVVGIVSIILAVLFSLPDLPIYTGDVMLYIGQWLTLASSYVGFATIIYNLIIDKVLDGLNLTSEKFLSGFFKKKGE